MLTEAREGDKDKLNNAERSVWGGVGWGKKEVGQISPRPRSSLARLLSSSILDNKSALISIAKTFSDTRLPSCERLENIDSH